eukprot:5814654-Heterocapsa_arctica.AAC.1
MSSRRTCGSVSSQQVSETTDRLTSCGSEVPILCHTMLYYTTLQPAPQAFFRGQRFLRGQHQILAPQAFIRGQRFLRGQ